MHAGVTQKPLFGGFAFVDVEVVQHDVEFTGRVGFHNIVHETQEVDGRAPVSHVRDYLAGGNPPGRPATFACTGGRIRSSRSEAFSPLKAARAACGREPECRAFREQEWNARICKRSRRGVVRTRHQARCGRMEWRRRSGWGHRGDAIRSQCTERDRGREEETRGRFGLSGARS